MEVEMKTGLRSPLRVLGVFRFGIVMTSLGLTAVACGGDDDAPPSHCDEPQVECGGECVDLSSSADHCGACDSACGSGEACFDGLCCAEGSQVCDGSCVDIAT